MSSSFSLLMTPGPTNLPSEVVQAMARQVIDHRSPEFRSMYERIQQDLKYLFQTESDVYTLTTSGTGGLECVLRSLVSPGDRVVLPVLGVFSQRLATNVKNHGGQIVEMKSKAGSAPTAAEVESILKKEKDVKLVAVVYNETSTGVTVRQLPEIASIAKDHGALVFVDAISILGGDRLPVDKWGVDICVTGSQKCMAAPPGLAFMSLSDEAWKAVEKKEIHSEYFNLKRIKEYHQRSETPFTPAVSLFFALEQAVSIIRKEGLDNRISRHTTCAQAFYAGIEAMDLSIFPTQPCRSNTVIAINMPQNVEDAKFRGTLRDKYGVSLAGGMGDFKGKMFRIGCMGIVSRREVLLTLAAVGSALNELGMQIDRGKVLAAALAKFA